METNQRLQDIYDKLTIIEKILNNERLNKSTEPNSRLLTPSDLAQQLQIAEGTIYNMISRKKIPYIKLGKLVRFDQAKIEIWLRERSIKTRLGSVTI